ncbi:UDP-2,3-diacylglucosamine hydrolase, partial [Yersinia pestis PY-64]
MLMLYIFWV